MKEELQARFDYLIDRLRIAYDGIGHSSGRPYIYFVYHPTLELEVRRMVTEYMRNNAELSFHHIDLLPLTVESVADQEMRIQGFLADPQRKKEAVDAIVHLWTRVLLQKIALELENTEAQHPVIVLSGLAALHPLSHPRMLMEFLAQNEPRNPRTHAIVPIVVLVPGTRPPQMSRCYYFLGQERLLLDFYRGEEI